MRTLSLCVYLLVLFTVLAGVNVSAQGQGSSVPTNVPLNCAPFEDVSPMAGYHACHGILNFPHFADGDGWDSKFMISAPTMDGISYDLTFIDSTGAKYAANMMMQWGNEEPGPGNGAYVGLQAGSSLKLTLTNYASHGQTGSVWFDVWGTSPADLYAQQVQMVYLGVRPGPSGGYLLGPGSVWDSATNSFVVSPTGYPVHRWQIPVLGYWVYPVAVSQAKPVWLQPITMSTRVHLNDSDSQRIAFAFTNVASVYNTMMAPLAQDITVEVHDSSGVLITSHTYQNVPPLGHVAGLLDQLFDPATNPGVTDMYPSSTPSTAATVDLQVVFRGEKPLTAMAIVINGQAMSSPAPIPLAQ